MSEAKSSRHGVLTQSGYRYYGRNRSVDGNDTRGPAFVWADDGLYLRRELYGKFGPCSFEEAMLAVPASGSTGHKWDGATKCVVGPELKVSMRGTVKSEETLLIGATEVFTRTFTRTFKISKDGATETYEENLWFAPSLGIPARLELTYTSAQGDKRLWKEELQSVEPAPTSEESYKKVD